MRRLSSRWWICMRLKELEQLSQSQQDPPSLLKYSNYLKFKSQCNMFRNFNSMFNLEWFITSFHQKWKKEIILLNCIFNFFPAHKPHEIKNNANSLHYTYDPTGQQVSNTTLLRNISWLTKLSQLKRYISPSPFHVSTLIKLNLNYFNHNLVKIVPILETIWPLQS